MLWLKRNLFLVVGILISLGLLGGAVFYLVTEYTEADELQQKFDQVKGEFKSYQEKSPTPNKENIALSEADTKRLMNYVGDVRKLFKTPVYTKLDDAGFRILLENTISELTKGATNSAVAIPEKYKFTFTSQTQRPRYATNSIQPLFYQLMEVKSLCNLLYQCRVTALDSVKRAPVSVEDVPLTSGDYLDRRISTNQLGVMVPYELTFRCFSTELASVLNAFARTEEFIIIKNLVVQGEAPTVVEAPPPPVVGSEGGPPRMTPPPPTTPGATPATKGKAGKAPVLKTVMDEKQLRVTLLIELIRAPQPGTAYKAAPGAAAPAGQPAPPPGQPAAAAPGQPSPASQSN